MKQYVGQIIQVMGHMHGLDVSRYDTSFLVKSLGRRLRATSIKSRTAYLQRLSDDRAEAEALFRSLRITYSEFFRNPFTFALLEQVVLPGLVQEKEKSDRGPLRVWSAGCAAGQEAYSVAILLYELAAAQGHSPSFQIIATDVCDAEMVLARQGVYDAAAVQNVRLEHIQKCFGVSGGSYAIVPALKDRVDFSFHDLLDERRASPAAAVYGDFDLVLCCNVLFYYRQDIRHQILDSLCRTLRPGGYVVTGEAERDFVATRGGLRAVAPPTPVFRKSSTP